MCEAIKLTVNIVNHNWPTKAQLMMAMMMMD